MLSNEAPQPLLSAQWPKSQLNMDSRLPVPNHDLWLRMSVRDGSTFHNIHPRIPFQHLVIHGTSQPDYKCISTRLVHSGDFGADTASNRRATLSLCVSSSIHGFHIGFVRWHSIGVTGDLGKHTGREYEDMGIRTGRTEGSSHMAAWAFFGLEAVTRIRRAG